MHKKICNFIIPAAILIGMMPLFMLHAETQDAAQEQGKNREKAVIAIPVGQDGAYIMSIVMNTVTRVKVVSTLEPQNEAKHRILSTEEWSIDKETDLLKIAAPVKAGLETVYVYGKRAVPWAWRFNQELDRNGVEMTLGGRALVLGEDYEVDEKKGVLRLLKEELCRKDLKFDMSLAFKKKPGQPFMSWGFSVSGPDDEIKPFPSKPKKGKRTMVSGTALPTNDPMVYTLSRPLVSDRFSMAVAKKAHFAYRNLLRDKDYTFNAEKQNIHLLKKITLDPETEYLFVHGLPPEPVYIFEMDEPLVPGSVYFYLNGAYLEEGRGFLVDYITGRIAILDPAWKKKGCKYSILAGTICMGNCTVPPPPERKENSKR